MRVARALAAFKISLARRSPAELGVLPVQPPQLLGLGRGRPLVASAVLGLVLADPVP